jgi:hypothetical protein
MDLDRDLADRSVTSDRDGDDVADQPAGVGDPLAGRRELPGQMGLLDPVDVVDRHRGNLSEDDARTGAFEHTGSGAQRPGM